MQYIYKCECATSGLIKSPLISITTSVNLTINSKYLYGDNNKPWSVLHTNIRSSSQTFYIHVSILCRSEGLIDGNVQCLHGGNVRSRNYKNKVAMITEHYHRSIIIVQTNAHNLQKLRDDHTAVQDYRSHPYYTANETLFNKNSQSTSMNHRDPINK